MISRSGHLKATLSSIPASHIARTEVKVTKGANKKSTNYIHPGRLTWNLQVIHLERKMIFQTSMIMFHLNLQACIHKLFVRQGYTPKFVYWRAIIPNINPWKKVFPSHPKVNPKVWFIPCAERCVPMIFIWYSYWFRLIHPHFQDLYILIYKRDITTIITTDMIYTFVHQSIQPWHSQMYPIKLTKLVSENPHNSLS